MFPNVQKCNMQCFPKLQHALRATATDVQHVTAQTHVVLRR